MKFNLKEERKKIGMDKATTAKAAGLTLESYTLYEERGEMPCKYIYRIWEKNNEFYLPEDFFYYTSYSLKCNMHYHGLTQADVANAFEIPSQSNISLIMKRNVPMYEYKHDFLSLFDPLIVPCRPLENGTLVPITNLVAKGNFMARKIRLDNKKEKNVNIKFIEEGDEC